jgi:hypothetical protein
MQSLGFKVLASSHTLTKVPPISCTSRHSISSVFNITCCILPPLSPLKELPLRQLNTPGRESYKLFFKHFLTNNLQIPQYVSSQYKKYGPWCGGSGSPTGRCAPIPSRGRASSSIQCRILMGEESGLRIRVAMLKLSILTGTLIIVRGPHLFVYFRVSFLSGILDPLVDANVRQRISPLIFRDFKIYLVKLLLSGIAIYNLYSEIDNGLLRRTW